MESNTTTSPRATLNRNTILRPGAPSCIAVLRHATHQIEGLCSKLMQEANDLEAEVDTQSCFVMQALTARIKALNSVLMSYTDGDDITLADGYKVITGLTDADPFIETQARPAGVSPETDYMEGVKLAGRMVVEGSDYGRDHTRSVTALGSEFRDDNEPQANFVLSYLLQVIENPALAVGFAAVLTEVLGVEEGIEVVYRAGYPGLTYEQIVGTPTAAAATLVRTPSPEADYMAGHASAIDMLMEAYAKKPAKRSAAIA